VIREARAIAGRFPVEGRLVAVAPFEGGHINDSFLVTYRHEARSVRYLLQRINDAVFRAPERMMDNIRRVAGHITKGLTSLGTRDAERRVLTVVNTIEDKPCARDATGSYWRLYRFIEGARAHQSVKTPEQAERAGRAFGEFQRSLVDLPGPRLHETIPGFHDTPSRFEALEKAADADPHRRAAAARGEIERAFAYRALAGELLDRHASGEIPERVVHNDAKISNILFDRRTGEALCVVDLDTVMPGLAPHDFGDMVRSMTCPAAEDETDLSRVELQMPLFAALARGYIEAAGAVLTPAERAHLVTAGKVITFEQAVRFLTDFLNGDRYYRTTRANQNLDRCRSQLRLLESITRHEREMVGFMESL
jgi:aminoglycoside phosphotransferase (APT) family kinase protein